MKAMGKKTRSAELKAEAEQYLPGGVGANARYNPVLGQALYVARGEGCRIWDVDGREYIDLNLSHGATFLGHGHPTTVAAVHEALAYGAVCGYDTDKHVELARLICQTIPCAERVRFANSGSEATMVALRLARAVTGRRKILKFWGHFHGLHDYVLYNAHSPLEAQAGHPITPMRESAGIPPDLDDLVIVVPWNDQDALDAALAKSGPEIAAIIMEPINYNQGCIVPQEGYLEAVRRRCTERGIVLVFDEVLSAFRTGPDCAQGYYGVTPDLCTVGKAVANGLPIAIVAGRKDLMEHLRPGGDTAHSGTYSGHLFAVCASIATLREIQRPGFYDHILAAADRLYSGLNGIFARRGLKARAQGLGARFGIYFGITEPVVSVAQAWRQDGALTAQFIRAAADRGVYLHNYGSLVTGHHGTSASHTTADIDETLDRLDGAAAALARGGA
jgi:glutamate-1-semialdehyde 2,1-aminomutase